MLLLNSNFYQLSLTMYVYGSLSESPTLQLKLDNLQKITCRQGHQLHNQGQRDSPQVLPQDARSSVTEPATIPTTLNPKAQQDGCSLYSHNVPHLPCRPRRNAPQRPIDSKPRASLEGVKCYNCNKKGHLASNYPQKALFCSLLPPEASKEQERVCHHGTINGIYTQDIVADTGASKTLVHKSFVSPTEISNKSITISCAHGDSITYPLAHVKISICKRDIIIQAALVDKLPVAVLLGWDNPNLMDFVKPHKLTPALAAVTHQLENAEAAPPSPAPTPPQPAFVTDDSNSDIPEQEHQQT